LYTKHPSELNSTKGGDKRAKIMNLSGEVNTKGKKNSIPRKGRNGGIA